MKRAHINKRRTLAERFKLLLRSKADSATLEKDSLSDRRSVMCVSSRATERMRVVIPGKLRAQWRFFFLSTSLLLHGVLPCAKGSVVSSELRELATNPFLFWTVNEHVDITFDAAAKLFEPIDLFLRGGALDSKEDTLTPENPVEEEQTASKDTFDTNNTEVDIQKERGAAVHDSENLVFSLFQEGDGSETDPEGIPVRYLKMQLYRRDQARKALESTIQWRKDHNIDHILKEPHPKFDICKEIFPHYFVGRDRDKHVVFVQRPALLDLDKAKANGLTNEDLLMHYVYVNEYLWQILEADSPLGTMTSVIDLQGLHIGVLRRPDILGFLKKFVSIMDAHYPQRANKTLILNAPKWFNMLYKLISPLLRESTKAKIEIHCRGKKQDKALIENLGESAKELLPPSFWSKHKGVDDAAIKEDAGHKLADHKMERELRSFVSGFCEIELVNCVHFIICSSLATPFLHLYLDACSLR